MYAGKTSSVPIPNVGHVHINSKGYVYWEDDGKWDNERKRTVDGRKSIGKVDPDSKGHMFPNKEYFLIFDDTNPATGMAPELTEPPALSKTLNYGAYIALRTSAEKIGCIDALQKTFPDIWDRIFAAALHSIIAENSVAQDVSYWCFHNYCGLPAPLSSSEMSRLYEAIVKAPESIPDFIYRFKESYHQQFPESDETVVGFDSTNQNTFSENIGLAEYGHPKVREGLPDINTGLFVDENTGIPLYYEHFFGSLLDKTQAPFTLEKVEDLGFRKLFLMMDRGYFSQKTLKAADEFGFGIMCPGGLNFVKDLLKEYSEKIKDKERYYIPDEDIYGIRVSNVSACGNNYDCFVYYDSRRAEDERATIHTKLEVMKKNAYSRKRYSQKLHDIFAPWFEISPCEKDPETGRSFIVKENSRYIQKCLDRAGFFVILSNMHIDAHRMIRIARLRDSNEKAFKRIKSNFDLSKTYSHNIRTYEGKMFIAFVALIIVEAYRWYIRPELKAITSTTTATTIGELNKYQIQLKRDGSWMPMYAFTKKQRQLFSHLQLTEAKVRKEIDQLRLRV